MKKRKKILVISGGGFKGVYAVGILKGLEELGLDKEIDAIFGVSIGAIIGSLWSYGLEADQIFKLLNNVSINQFYTKNIFKKTGGLLSNEKFKDMLEKYLPNNFSSLNKNLYIGAVDANRAKFILFEKGDLPKIVLGSMAIPGIFPPVKYKNYNLVDGGVLNNFPVDLAKKLYPKSKIIGIALQKFKKNQTINTAINNLLVNFEIMLRTKVLENTRFVDHLFYKEIPISILSLDKKKMTQVFDMGYQDCIKEFGKGLGTRKKNGKNEKGIKLKKG
ncbi:MAG: patatin-like phospholipase family protein [Candidatus Absconditabacterales bacterium]|nr:patatin-like phospholipase family protein [Candidatus Absconditabacterales bacterium]